MTPESYRQIAEATLRHATHLRAIGQALRDDGNPGLADQYDAAADKLDLCKAWVSGLRGDALTIKGGRHGQAPPV